MTAQARIIEADAPAFSYTHHVAYCDFLGGLIDRQTQELSELRDRIAERSRNMDAFPGRRAEVRQLEAGISPKEARIAELHAALRWANEFAQA
jgi:hypothetical protein